MNQPPGASPFRGRASKRARPSMPSLPSRVLEQPVWVAPGLTEGEDWISLPSSYEEDEMFHNRKRRHSSLGMLTPIEYEHQRAS